MFYQWHETHHVGNDEYEFAECGWEEGLMLFLAGVFYGNNIF